MWSDIHSAIRNIGKKPFFYAIVILTLALGIGANAAIFTVVNAVLLRPLPFPEPDRLMMLWTYNPRQGFDKDVGTYPNFEEWQRSSQSFARISGYGAPSFTLTGLGDPVQIRGGVVTSEFFETMGTPPLLGRTFITADAAAGAGQSVVLSYGFWRDRLGQDASAVGRRIMLDAASYEIVGVMPAGFAHPDDVEVWTPMTPTGRYGQYFTSRGTF